MTNEIVFNNFSFIIIDIAIGCIMAFTAILAYGKSKKITHLFFVISALFLYISMIFRILKELNVFILSEYILLGVPLYQNIANYMPLIFLTIGFLILLNEK